MGLFDFFKKKPLALSQGTTDKTNQQLNIPSSSDFDNTIKVEPSTVQASFHDERFAISAESKTQVFPVTEDGIKQYVFCRENTKQEKITIATLTSSDFKTTDFKLIAKQLDHLINNPLQNSESNSYTLNRLKHQSVETLKDLPNRIQGLSIDNNLYKIINNMRIGEQALQEVLATTPDSINYSKLNEALEKSFDFSKYSPKEITSLGKILNTRLETLDNIHTPDEAYEQKTSITSFLKSQETQTPLDKIIALLGGDIKEADMPIILKCAKALEGKQNEDGLLYSAYLKLEEKRVINQLQQDISEYSQNFDESSPQYSEAHKQIDYLETLKIQSANPENGLDLNGIINFMVNTIHKQDLTNYIGTNLKNDLAFKSYLKNNPEINHYKEALTFMGARISSLGQVSDIPEENRTSPYPTLRTFLETTDYKSPENKENKDFLLVMAQTEKDYIKGNYSSILSRCKELQPTQK